MILPRFSDSIARAAELPPCPSCGADARVNGGTCVNCLLRAGLDQTLEIDDENFDDVLSEIEVRDAN